MAKTLIARGSTTKCIWEPLINSDEMMVNPVQRSIFFVGDVYEFAIRL